MDLVNLVFGTYGSWSHLVVRLALGIIFFAHGAQKVLGWFGGPGLKGTVGYMKQALGVPAPLAVLASLSEVLGGISMVVGLLVRPLPIRLIVVILVAISKGSGKNGLFINFPNTPGNGLG